MGYLKKKLPPSLGAKLGKNLAYINLRAMGKLSYMTEDL